MYVINEKYRNSRQVDYNRWSDAVQVDQLVDVLVAGMKANLCIVKTPGYKNNMKTLLMELYHSYLTDQEQYIAFYRSTGHYKFKVKLSDDINANRYQKNFHITHTYFTGCIDYLTPEYIEVSDGGSFRDGEGGSYGYLSRMRATAALVVLWEKYAFTPDMIKRFQPEEVIILKDKVVKIEYTYKGKKRFRKYKAPIPDYPDTRHVRDMRALTEKYNLLLDRTHIDVDVDCITSTDRDDLLDRLLHTKNKFRYSINLGSKQVYRVFNNNSFYEGGRFYGAWWIGCPSLLRKYITINGEPTVDLDFSGIHIHILYAFKKINFPELKTDAYELVPNDPQRKLNKQILLTAYNATGPRETAKAVFKNAIDDGIKHKLGLKNHKQVYEKLELLKQKHPQIADFIAEGFGSKLQYHDSCVLELLIKYFTKLKIPILTVHDSIICQSKYKDLVHEKMMQLYTLYVNKTFKCTTEYSPTYPHRDTIFQELSDSINKDTWKLINTTNLIATETFNYTGRIPEIKNTVIEVSEKSTQYKCSSRCKHSIRDTAIKSGKKIFLGKIRIQTEVIDNVVSVKIIQ